jgi:hypothetical protein
MIAWFDKHLDLALVFHTVFAWYFAIILVVSAVYLSGNPDFFRDTWFPGWYSTYNVIADIAIAVSLPVYYLIQKRKKQSVWLLILIVVPFIPLPGAALILFLMPFWLLGLIIMICLRDKRSDKTTQQQTKSGNTILY